MTTIEYLELFESDNRNYKSYSTDYQEYIILNKARFKRWIKQGNVIPELIKAINQLKEEQYWLIITEPWCGDAAQSLPFLFKIAALNPLIKIEIQLRDTNSEINRYLNDGKRGIPKLIIRNKQGIDLFTWGPQPQSLEYLINKLKKENLSKEAIKVSEQKWYNEDKGQSLQQELLQILSANRI